METRGLYGMYDVLHIPFWQTVWFRATIGALLFIGFSGVLFFVWKKLQMRKRKSHSWERALALLDEISKRDLMAIEQRRVLYYDLTRILKEYCGERYGWDIGGLTDQESIHFLLAKKVDTRLQYTFKQVVQGCELIKFAQESVDCERIQADCLLCKEFIRATIPSEQR